MPKRGKKDTKRTKSDKKNANSSVSQKHITDDEIVKQNLHIDINDKFAQSTITYQFKNDIEMNVIVSA
jgi:hypothetical protein